EKDYALVWHYRMVPPDLAYVRLSNLKHELESELNEDEVGIHSGNKILEIKPKHVHKGRVLRDLIRELAPDFVLAAGDDYTDEDMFEELPRDGVGIKVGFGETKARYQVASVEQMIALLRSLC
ncbi:MAG TPA: trehalose-phosphatase, partial [Candidatus Saccharibacteria bacterium]|nr:trehalose-phosphatase [Candidatus Saccharibacteria bacterium]